MATLLLAAVALVYTFFATATALSHAILIYLADTYGKTDDFYPKDLKRRALVNQKLFFDTAVLLPRLLRVSTSENARLGETHVVSTLRQEVPRTWGSHLRRYAKPFQNFSEIPEEMPIKLYKMDTSPAARAAMMACELFNAPVEFVDVNLMAGEHMTPEYLKKNPLHAVPVFEDGDFFIHDSHAILMYLADKYGKSNEFYPKDVKQRAFVNQKLFFDTAVLYTRLSSISMPVWTEGKSVITENQIKNIEEAYAFVEEFLSRTKYIAANHITIADLSTIATMTSITIPILPLDKTKYPKTHAWMKDMESQKYCKKHNEAGATAYGNAIKPLLDFSNIKK